MIDYVRKISRPFLIVLILVIFLSVFKLSESPPVWLDEGIITQVAMNMASFNVHGLEVSPDHFISAGFVTTGYPVTFPISLAFRIFGIHLLTARFVMVLFILFMFIAMYNLAIKHEKGRLLWLILLLVASFAPIYGDGKSVLGEIPGLLFLTLFFICVNKIDAKHSRNLLYTSLGGLALGLAISTKPIFLLAIPAALVVVFLLRKVLTWKDMLIGFVCMLIPFGLWIWVQFSNDSFFNILGIYANPHSNDILVALSDNLRRFITEPQPFYCLVLFVVWTISLYVRYKKNISFKTGEIGAFIFALLVLLAYTRTSGYYRYFFPAQIYALVYFPAALIYLVNSELAKKSAYLFLLALAVFQLYQVHFNSWVAQYYNSIRTAELTKSLSILKPDDQVLIYQAPETAIFLPTQQYSQYLEVTKTIIIGLENIEKLRNMTPTHVITTIQIFDDSIDIFEKYEVESLADRYVLLRRK